MRLWKVIVLLNLALGLGAGLGYLRGTRDVRDLRAEVAKARAAAAEAEARAGQRSWTARGVVRAVLPRLRTVFITHEAIPGLMEGMTMGFEVEDPTLLDSVKAGDAVRFTLRRKDDRVYLVAIEKVRNP